MRRVMEETRYSTYEELKEEGYSKVDIDLEKWYRGYYPEQYNMYNYEKVIDTYNKK